MVDKRPARDPDSVFIPRGQMRRLLDDLAAFAGARSAYATRGVPWRRGYMFDGPPGTGKSTLILTLAGSIGRQVYTLSLSSLASDNELLMAVNGVGQDGVLAIEDIDAASASHDRESCFRAACH